MRPSSILMVLLLFAGCAGDTYESLSDEMFNAFDEINTIMTTIKDPDSAKKAGDQLKELSKKFHDITLRMKALGDVSHSIDEEYLKKRTIELGNRFHLFSQEIKRVKDIKGAEEVFNTLKSFKKSLMNLDHK